MALDEHGILAAVELASFTPILGLAIYICTRQGFEMEKGWVYLIVLPVVRIIASICLVVSQNLPDPPQALEHTYAANNLFGAATLLLALLGFMQRVAESMGDKGPPARLFRYINLATLADFILAIIGVVTALDDPYSVSQTSHTLRKASGTIFLVIFVLLAAVVFWALIGHCWVPLNETRLVHGATAALPFLLVRIVYNVVVVYSEPGGLFWWRHINIFAQAFMQFAMEVAVAAMYFQAGFRLPKVEKQEAKGDTSDAASQELGSPGDGGGQVRTKTERPEE
ncbi:hypothetical protein MBLNU230_g8102t1 [Neophaeotheca triangularis]